MSKTGLALALVCSLCGCATMTRTSVDYLYVLSKPEGALASTSTGKSCRTPCTLIAPRNSSFELRVKLEGHETFVAQIAPVSRFSKTAGAAQNAGKAAAGAAGGAAGGLAAAGAAGEVGLALGGSLGVTSAGASIVGGAIVVGATAPLVVDSATKANHNLAPNPVIVTLKPLNAAAPAGPQQEFGKTE